MVLPINNPAAPGSQYGARSPENAGTKYTLPVSGTDAASLFISLADLMKPKESRNLRTRLRRLRANNTANIPFDGTSGNSNCAYVLGYCKFGQSLYLLLPSRAYTGAVPGPG